MPLVPADPVTGGRQVLAARLHADVRALRGASVLVTGAAGGIGRALCAALHALGTVVVATDLSADALETVAADLRVPADLTDLGEPDRLVGLAADVTGRLDAVVNNAGVYDARPMLELAPQDWQRVLAVNLEAPVALMTSAARRMLGQERSGLGRRGLVLNVSSAAGDQGRPPLASYAASKAALNNATSSAAMSLEPDDVVVAAVYPGNVREGMWRGLGAELAAATGRDRDAVEAEREFQPADELADLVCQALALPGTSLTGRLVAWDGRVLTL